MKIPARQFVFLAAAGIGLPMALLPAMAQHQHTDPSQPQSRPQAAVERQSGGLRLEDLLQMAAQNNPVLKQADANIRAAEGKRKQAGLYPNPSIGYTGDEIARGPIIRGGEHGFFVEQTLVTAGKLGNRRELFSREVGQAEAEAEIQRFRVTNAVRQLFYRALAAERRVEVRAKLAELAGEAVRTSYGLFNVGQADQPDILEVEIEAQRMKLDLEEAKDQLARTWQELAAAVGNPALQPGPLSGHFDQSLPSIDAAAALQEILRASPEMKLAQAGLRRAESAVTLARSERIPDIVARGGLRYNRELLELGVMPVGLEGFADVGIRIPLFNRNQGNIEAAQSEVLSAEQELRRVELSLRARFGREFARYQTARRMAESYKSEVLPRAEKAYEMYLTKFKEMAAAYPQVLIAQRTLFESSARYVSSVEELWSAAISLQGYLLAGDAEAAGSGARGGHAMEAASGEEE